MQDIILFFQHHTALCLALIIIVLLLIILEYIKSSRNAGRLTPAKAIQLINHGKAVVVDIRDQGAFSSGHIIGAISLPAMEIKNNSKKLTKFKSRPIVIVCAAGTESQRTAALLVQQGFDARVLSGGLRAWREADMPLVKG